MKIKNDIGIISEGFEIHAIPLEKIEIEAHEISIFLDDVNGERYKITACPYQAFKVVTIDCCSAPDYYKIHEYCYRNGVYHRHILEVENSGWIKELRESLTDKRATFLDDAKHYVFPLQESVIELVAGKIAVERVKKE